MLNHNLTSLKFDTCLAVDRVRGMAPFAARLLSALVKYELNPETGRSTLNNLVTEYSFAEKRAKLSTDEEKLYINLEDILGQHS